MYCPICDQKPMNCDCTKMERQQFSDIEDLEEEIARLRITVAEREAVSRAADRAAESMADIDAATLRGLLERNCPVPLPEPPEVKQ